MFATIKSKYVWGRDGVFTLLFLVACGRSFRKTFQVIVAVALAALMGTISSSAQEQEQMLEWAIGQARHSFDDWQARWQPQPTNSETAWQFARACFMLGDLVEHDTERARIAREGIQACRQILEAAPKLGPAHYYLAMNLGELARTDKLAALGIIHEMEKEFIAAIELSPDIDYAGPHRSVGMLYRDAPGWLTGIGNRSKAKKHLEKAVAMAPEYPENWLVLLESYLKWGEKQTARERLPAVEKVLETARKQFTGDQWRFSWHDWEERWEKIKRSAAVKVLESPRSKS